MPWNDPDFLRWASVTHAKLGTDSQGIVSAANATNAFFTVPANHVYLIRNASVSIRAAAIDSALSQAQLFRGAAAVFIFGQGLFPVAGSVINVSHTFFYPLAAIAGDIARAISNLANTTVVLSASWTDVDLTKFPFV